MQLLYLFQSNSNILFNMQMVCNALKIIQWQTLSRFGELWILLTATNELSDSLFFICAFVFPISLAFVIVTQPGSHSNRVYALGNAEKHYHLHYCHRGKLCSSMLSGVDGWNVWKQHLGIFPLTLRKKNTYQCYFFFYFTNNLFFLCPLELTKAACNECYLYIKAISRISIMSLPGIWNRYRNSPDQPL